MSTMLKTDLKEPAEWQLCDHLYGGWYEEEALARLSGDELMALLSRLTRELQRRSTRGHDGVRADLAGLQFPDTDEIGIDAFAEIPANGRRNGNALWRVVLAPADPSLSPLALDVRGDFVVGHNREGGSADLDLTEHGAVEWGVSRKHAHVRPTPEGLYLKDLGSLNGTYCNGERVDLKTGHVLNDGDTVSFGSLHFKLRILARPNGAGE